MARIETGLHAHFAAGANAPDSNGSSRFTELGNNTQELSSGGVTFAKVRSVVPNSPAYAAGLRAGDDIQMFGEADWLNHENLSMVAQVVSRYEGVMLTRSESRYRTNECKQRPILVKVVRNDALIQLMLTPTRDWGGRGMLGCHLVTI